jgi:hypothetical protein
MPLASPFFDQPVRHTLAISDIFGYIGNWFPHTAANEVQQMENNTGKYAVKLARNPIGIIALFVVLVEGVAGVVAVSGDLDNVLKTILVVFIVAFPIGVLAVFCYIVIKYPGNLYAPADFQDQSHFMEIIGRRVQAEVEHVSADALKELVALDIELIPIWEARNLHRPEDSQKKMELLTSWVDKLESLTKNSEGSRKVASAAALREVYMQYLEIARAMWGSGAEYYKRRSRVVDGLKKISGIRD